MSFNDTDAAQRILTGHRNADALLDRIGALAIELPSWGFADTGTRFGKFHQPAAARTIEEKIDDAALVHKLTGQCPSVAVHVLWDFPDGFDPALMDYAARAGVTIGAINPNVFQDQIYKYGSFASHDAKAREQAVQHCLDCVALARQTGSEYISLWFADGINYPGQDDLVARKHRMAEGLATVHAALDPGMTMLVEYKPFEPAFYATDIADWGMSYLLAKQAGPQAKVLVDTGHHYLSQNIEQIVAWLIDEGMLGGFHFNDRRYADDDLTLGSIDPYQVFRIFNEIAAAEHRLGKPLDIAYMVDQSHNLKGKIEAMIQTVDMAVVQWARALLVDREALAKAQSAGDVVAAENVLRDAFATDVRPLVGMVRQRQGLAPDALAAFRASGYAATVAREREARHGSGAGGSYA